MTDNNQPDVNGAQNVVYVKKRSTYTPFLLVMLILSSIFTAISTIGLIVIVANIASGSYNDTGLVRIFVDGISAIVALASIAALALLWMRKKEGIILKFVLLILTVAGSLFSVGIAKDDLLSSSKECRDVMSQQSSLSMSSDLNYNCEDEKIAFNVINSFGENLVVFGIILSVFWNGGIATLWYFAWRAQEKHDGIEKFLGKKTAK